MSTYTSLCAAVQKDVDILVHQTAHNSWWIEEQGLNSRATIATVPDLKLKLLVKLLLRIYIYSIIMEKVANDW